MLRLYLVLRSTNNVRNVTEWLLMFIIMVISPREIAPCYQSKLEEQNYHEEETQVD